MGSKIPALVLFLAVAPVSYGATVSGTVKGPDGAPFEGAFVQAQNINTKITVMALSGLQGRYRIEKLPVGTYRVLIKAVGYRSDPRAGLNIAADQNLAIDFALQRDMVRWNELSLYQAKQLWPPAKGKDLMFGHCSICHEFQTLMASVSHDENGWKDRLAYMRQVMHYSIFLGAHFSDQDSADVASYLATLFGPESVLPKSPAEMSKYKETLRPFSSDAMNIVYVEYEMPGPRRMPFSAAPDKDGYLWIPNFGPANKITRLNPDTGEMQDFPVPHVGSAGVHSAVPAPDGSVWLTEQGSNKLGKWDPRTQKIIEYQDQYLPGQEGVEDGGSKHTLRLDPSGRVWSSGNPLTQFDPETKKYARFAEVPSAYDVKTDRNGDVWFTRPGPNEIGKVDGKTKKVSRWSSPTPGSAPRRLEITADGMVWVGEFFGGKLARFEPKTETFTEYPLPGPEPFPYGLGIDADGYIWYDSHNMDVLGRFDPKTGRVVEYPFPHSELAIREFFRDSKGRMWYGSAPNNIVGYFYLTSKDSQAAARR